MISFRFENAQTNTNTAHTESKALIQVRVRWIEAQPFADTISVTGRTQASRDIEMKAEITGEVRALLKEEGQSVRKGDVLAEIELRGCKAREIEARQRVEQRRIEYKRLAS